MDISPDLKKLKEKSEPGSEKPSRDSTAPESAIEVDGKVYRMPGDLKQLDEIDYDDPSVRQWLAEKEAESVQLAGTKERQPATTLRIEFPGI